jgi:hypothetical protein
MIPAEPFVAARQVQVTRTQRRFASDMTEFLGTVDDDKPALLADSVNDRVNRLSSACAAYRDKEQPVTSMLDVFQLDTIRQFIGRQSAPENVICDINHRDSLVSSFALGREYVVLW